MALTNATAINATMRAVVWQGNPYNAGTVLYNVSAYYFVVDQKNLEQGLLSIVTYAPNGEMEEALVRPYGLMHLLAFLEREHPLSDLPGGGARALQVQ